MRGLLCGALAVVATACTNGVTAPTSDVTRPATVVDVVDFIVGDPGLWPRRGDQMQHQVIAGPQVCWVKYGRSDMYECWRWDDQWVYHVIDYALDGDTGESYRFTDGRWLPRYLTVTDRWALNVAENRVQWRGRDCHAMAAREGIPDPSGVHLFPYRLEAWVEPQTRIGGDLGTRDVLMLAYAPYAPGSLPGEPELFAFAKGAGWYQWRSPRGSRSFTFVGGPQPVPVYPCGWR